MNTALVSIGLPISLGITMVGLGLLLTPADFRLVARHPKAGLVVLTCQIVVLPLLCLGLVQLLGLSGADAAGLMLLVATPGGTAAGLLSYLGGGDAALNISLTGVNTVLSIITLPVIAGLAITHYLPAEERPAPALWDFMKVVLIVIVPVLMGMALRRTSKLSSAGYERLEHFVKIASVCVLLLTVGAALYEQHKTVTDGISRVGAAVILLSLTSLTLGYWIPRWLRISRRQSISSTMEIGIHNSVLAITIALDVLDQPELALAPAAYAVIGFIPAGTLAYVFRRSERALKEPRRNRPGRSLHHT